MCLHPIFLVLVVNIHAVSNGSRVINGPFERLYLLTLYEWHQLQKKVHVRYEGLPFYLNHLRSETLPHGLSKYLRLQILKQ